MDMDNSHKTALILHGHFYQPPRENPFTGIVEKQISASPYMDWNERIYHDCYESNAHSRYLNPSSRILSLTNNYSYISFNFGHTLLSWMQTYHPDVHEMIVEADRESLSRLGHGNAMAQSFTANAPIAVKYSKACIDRGMQMDIDDGIALENELFAMCFATEDQKEGMGAFLEKRKEKHFQNK